jgi:hypothetical protein
LSGTLVDGTLTGPNGGSRTGSFLTAAFGTFTGGTLSPLVDANSASLAISLTEVLSPTGGPAGLQVMNNVLSDFVADATANMGALVPEPSLFPCMLLGMAILALGGRRR